MSLSVSSPIASQAAPSNLSDITSGPTTSQPTANQPINGGSATSSISTPTLSLKSTANASSPAPSTTSASDPIAQQIAQYSDILNDTTGAYTQNQQIQAFKALGALWGTWAGTGSSAVWQPNTQLTQADRSAALAASQDTVFGAKAEKFEDYVGTTLVSQADNFTPSNDPRLNLFQSLSSSDQQLYLGLGFGGSFTTSADYVANLQANLQLETYMTQEAAADGVKPGDNLADVKNDPTLKAALALYQNNGANSAGFADAVTSLLGSPDAADGASAQAAANSAGGGADGANATIAQNQKALTELSAPSTSVSNASAALTVLQNAAAQAQVSARNTNGLKAGDGPASAAGETPSQGLTWSGSWPYTQGSVASANA